MVSYCYSWSKEIIFCHFRMNWLSYLYILHVTIYEREKCREIVFQSMLTARLFLSAFGVKQVLYIETLMIYWFKDFIFWKILATFHWEGLWLHKKWFTCWWAIPGHTCECVCQGTELKCCMTNYFWLLM